MCTCLMSFLTAKSICARMHFGFARLLTLLWQCTYMNTHFSLFYEVTPPLETLYTHTDTVKVQDFAKLQQTGSLLAALPLYHCCHWNLSKLAVLLALEQLSLWIGSRVSPYFCISLHVSLYVTLYVRMWFIHSNKWHPKQRRTSSFINPDRFVPCINTTHLVT